jgi:hypothetical protein
MSNAAQRARYEAWIERNWIGAMHAEAWEAREAHQRRLGIQPGPPQPSKPRPPARSLSLLSLLLTDE